MTYTIYPIDRLYATNMDAGKYARTERCAGILNTIRVSSADAVSKSTHIRAPTQGMCRNWVRNRPNKERTPEGLHRYSLNQNRSNSKYDLSSTFIR